jgi:hypothetical protein
MIALGLTYAFLSGIANGLFTVPMKVIPRWKWENIWLVFIVTSCLALPAALGLGFARGFGAVLFGMSKVARSCSLTPRLFHALVSAWARPGWPCHESGGFVMMGKC